MRATALPLVSLTLAFLVTGCGATPTSPSATRTAGVVSAAAKVEEGELVFNKKIVYSTIDVLGIGKVYADKLKAAQIKNCNELLLAGAARSARAKLAKQTGISEKLLLTWINHADLMRVTGCGPEYARLLELAGVDTVMELAQRNAIHLVAQLKDANDDLGGGKVAVHRLPGIVTTTAWVEHAKTYARVVEY